MRNSLLIALLFFCLHFAGYAQNSPAVDYGPKNRIRLYAEAGMQFSKVSHEDGTRNNMVVFTASGISAPSFGLGAILEGASQKPKLYFGMGLSFTKLDYEGERYVKIISPSQEELEVYHGKHSILNINLFLGHYIHLATDWSLKPQLGMIIQTMPNNTLDINVYNFENGQFKRNYSYEQKRAMSMGGMASLYFSFRRSFELGATYFTTSNAKLTQENISKISSVGISARYIHSF